MILLLNGIECKDEELTESTKILNYGVVAKMRYERDLNVDYYYYLQDSGRHIYDDKIFEHVKEAFETTSISVVGLRDASYTSIDVKTLIDDILHKLLTNNQVREDWIMARIDALSHVSEKSILSMKLR